MQTGYKLSGAVLKRSIYAVSKTYICCGNNINIFFKNYLLRRKHSLLFSFNRSIVSSTLDTSISNIIQVAEEMLLEETITKSGGNHHTYEVSFLKVYIFHILFSFKFRH